MHIENLSKHSTLFNEQTVELLVPDILHHPADKVVPETLLLIQDQDNSKKHGSSFFVEVYDEMLPDYVSVKQNMIFLKSFWNQFDHPNNKDEYIEEEKKKMF